MSFTDRLIINAAITGMVPTRQDSPYVPLSPDEIATEARRCRDAGAAIVHLHARDAAGRPTCSADIYREILAKVHAACPDIILCVSTSGRVHKAFEQRSEVLDVLEPKPEMASLTLGSMNFAREESVNSPEMIARLARHMQQRGIVPELECFELGMAEYTRYLIRHDILKAPFYCNILLGSLGTLGASAMNLSCMVTALPPGTTWAAAGIGAFQFEVNCLAVTMGGHVRVGLEDNLWLDRAKGIHATNAQLIERIAQVARSVGREIATPDQARAMIGLPGRK